MTSKFFSRSFLVLKSYLRDFSLRFANFELLGKILIVVELIAIPLGLFGIYQANRSINLQSESNEQQIISSAWQQLTTPSSGNTGKGNALSALAKREVPLVNLRLDCETMGGRYVSDEILQNFLYCENAVVLNEIELISPNPDLRIGEVDRLDASGSYISASIKDFRIKNSDFSNARVDPLFLRSVEISDTNFSRSLQNNIYVEEVEFYNVDMSSSWLNDMFLSKVKIYFSDFSNSYFSGLYIDKGVEFSAVNVSGVNFCFDRFIDYNLEFLNSSEEDCVSGLTPEHVKGMWAWADSKPIGLGSVGDLIKDVTLCDPILRDDYEKSVRRKKGYRWLIATKEMPEDCS